MNIVRRHAILLVLLYASLAVVTAYATIIASKSLSATVTIQSATPGLAVLDYANAACTPELTSIAFLSLGPNPSDQALVQVCIGNVGNTNFWIASAPNVTSIVFSGIPPGISATWVRQGGYPLPVLVSPGSTIFVTLYLVNDGTAAPGSIIFTLTFRGFSTSTG